MLCHYHQAPNRTPLHSRMQHGRCAGCNVDITIDMTYASQKLENMDRTVVRSGNVPRVHEELPTHTHRHSQGTKAGSLDMDGSEDFHRRLSLDEVDPSQFPETYCDRMSGIELDKMKVIISSFTNYSSCLQESEKMNDIKPEIHLCWRFDRMHETQCSPLTRDGHSCSVCRPQSSG